MTQETALALARFVQTLGTLSLLGVLAFRVLVAPLARGLVAASLGLALLGGVAWAGLAAAGYGVPVLALLGGTGFGRWLLLRLGLLALAGGLARPLPWLALAAAGLGVAAAVLSSHAAAEADPLGMAVLALHLLAAGLWLGGLLPLWQQAGAAGMQPARRFGRWAGLAVAVLLLTATVQGLRGIVDLPGLLGTRYGQAGLVKAGLLLGLLGVAALNRFRAVPRGQAGMLRLGIGLEVGLGLGVLAAATVMGSSMPSWHDTPVWPFAWAPSSIALEEPELHDEVFDALHALLGAFALLLLAGLARRVRWVALIAAVAITGFALPHLDLLLVPAVPTSFQRSPTGFAATGIAEAARLYPGHCASCHGARGEGDGPMAGQMSLPPADLTAPHLWDHADGALYWMIAEGSRTADGRIGMPGLGRQLQPGQIWALIDYIRVRNAAVAVEADGNFDRPTPAPELQLVCADGSTPTLGAWRRQTGALVLRRGAPAVSTVPTIYLHPGPPPPGGCVAPDPLAWAGYAVLSASGAALAAEDWFVIDANGWLRRRGQGAAEAAWQAIRRDPLPSEMTPLPHQH